MGGAPPVTYGSGSAEAAVSGMAAMTDVIAGYQAGEQTNYERFVDDRNYGFAVDQFNESVRQFDVNFDENVRQFDTTIAFQEEQAQLQRGHEVYLQDDQQDWSSEEQLLQRNWQEVENKRDRAVEYHRIKKQVEMQNLDRGLQYRAYYLDDIGVALGGYNSYDEIPEHAFRDINGNTLYPGRDFDLNTELYNIAAGKGSSVIQVDANTARQIYSDMNAGKITPEQAAQMVTSQSGNVVVNQYKEEAVQKMMLQRVGNDPAMLASMSQEQQMQLRNAVIHDMNNYTVQRQRYNSEQLAVYAQQRQIDAGYDPQGGATPQGMAASLAAQNGQYFVAGGGQSQFPVYSGLGNTMIGTSMTRAQTAAIMAMEPPAGMDVDQMAVYQRDQQAKVDQEVQTMIQLGVPPDQAKWYGESLKAASNGTWSADMWKTMPGGKKMPTGSRPLGTSDGAVNSVPAAAGPQSSMIQTQYGWLPRDYSALPPNQQNAVRKAVAQEQINTTVQASSEKKKQELESLEAEASAAYAEYKVQFLSQFPNAPEWQADAYALARSNPDVAVPALLGGAVGAVAGGVAAGPLAPAGAVVGGIAGATSTAGTQIARQQEIKLLKQAVE